ncbi:MAG: DHH family phosphoesterase [Clostridia bacterium]|nr:DHH family phosphoesterase [Clostridia bacterium]
MPNSNGKILDKLTIKSGLHLTVIAVLLIILCTYDLRWIFPSILLFVALLFYTIVTQSKKKSQIVDHIEAIASDVNSTSKNNLVNSPIPLVLVETDGHIIWRSRTFIDEFQNTDMNNYLNPMVKEIKLDLEKDSTIKDFTKQITIGNKIYKIRGGVAKNNKRDRRKSNDYILTLYFIDDTKYNELFDTYTKSKTCIGIAMIDNYEEIAQTALPEEKIELFAKIEKLILDWAKETGGLIIKTERDSFVYIFEQQYLSDIEKNKFSILDKVKALDTEYKVQVTLSIAVSNEGKTNFEKYKSALAVMDVILGRGGDQAIVKRDGKFKFYGGNSLEVEKRNKVKARTTAHTMVRLIEEAENVIVMGHKNIDIDALGSALGIYRLATALNKPCYIATELSKSVEKFYEVLKESDEYKGIIKPEEDVESVIGKNTLLVIVDTHKYSYVEFPSLVDKIEKKIIIDHHRKSTDYIENAIMTFHEVYASSASELVTEILQYASDDINLNLIEAEALYGGIMIDTKDFTFKTGVRTFEAAAHLRKYGVDIIKVKKWFQADLESYNIIADIVKKAEKVTDTIAVSVCDSKDYENVNLTCAKAADELLTISDITASFVIGNLGDKICISGRSIGDVNVQIILEKMGGGGHITLAGAQLEGLTLEEAHDELIIRINEYLTEIM